MESEWCIEVFGCYWGKLSLGGREIAIVTLVTECFELCIVDISWRLMEKIVSLVSSVHPFLYLASLSETFGELSKFCGEEVMICSRAC